MSDELKKFVTEHRQEFDTNEPDTDLWKKIDAQLEVKRSSKISSKWLSTFKYLGFSASVLVVAVYFIANSQANSSAKELALNVKDSAIAGSAQYFKAYQNKSGSTSSENNVVEELNNLPGNKNRFQAPLPMSSEQHRGSTRDSLLNREKESVLNATSFEKSISDQENIKADNLPGFLPKEAGESNSNSAHEKKKTNLARNSKKADIYIPEEPGEMNSYTATLYDSFSFCAVLRAYKFPGKVIMKDGEFHQKSKKKKTKGVLRTASCGHMADMTNVKAIWIKGKTDKALALSIDKRLRNMVLVKSDGRELRPEAISHYYPGLGVITGYTGKFLKMAFKDKVGLILFFKDAEEGDRIIIDGMIEAVVASQP